MLRSVVCLGLLSLSLAFYSSSSPVQLLTQATYTGAVKSGSSAVFLVEFFSEGCGHCRALVPEYEKAAKALKGIAGVGAVDVNKEQGVPQREGLSISGVPSIKLYSNGQYIDYSGARTAQAIVDFVLAEMGKVARKRLGGGAGTGGSQGQQKASGGSSGDGDVVVLTDDNFESLVLQSKDTLWLIEFYAPWCGHCQKLQPEWDQAAMQLKSTSPKVKLAKVDCTVEKATAGKYQIQGYPTIKVFQPGKLASPADYPGGRTADAIISYAVQQADKLGLSGPLDIPQWLSQAHLDECLQQKVCFIAILPHILDSSSEERKSMRGFLAQGAKSQAGKPFAYLWAQGGDFWHFEQFFNLNAGYPAMIAVNADKQVYSSMRTAFTEKNVVAFMDRLMMGREPVNNFVKENVPKVKKDAKPWEEGPKQEL